MSLRDRQRQNTNAASLRRVARPQTQYGQRNGSEIVINGNPVRAQKVTNEPLGTGDPVLVSGDGGVTTQERRRLTRTGGVDRPIKEPIDLKILASGVDSAGTHIFIGGDRATPTEILVLPVGETISFSRIENLGAGLTRWIVALKTVNASGAYKIYTKFGENPSADWQIIDIKARILNYFGQGFWAGLLEKPPINFDTTVLPDIVGDGQTFFFNNRPGEVRGVVNCGLTEQEFWQVPTISKYYRFTESRGFLSSPRANLVPIPEWNFTGTNTLDSSTTVRCYWLGSPVISPQFYPHGNSIFRESLYKQDRNLTTQYPSFYAVNGTIQSYAGSYVYTEHREAMNTYLHRRYQGLDIEPPPGSNYNIGYDDALTISTTIQIGPNVSKSLRMDPGPRTNLLQDPTVTFDIPTSIENFEGGLVYSRFTGISTFYDDAYIFEGLVPPFTSPVTKQYLRLQDGTENEIKFTNKFPDYANNYIRNGLPPGASAMSGQSWRKSDRPDPDLRDIGGVPPVSSQYTPAVSPVLKERWNWTVITVQPINNAGVLDYTAQNVVKTEKTIKTYAVALSDTLTAQKILDAR